MGGCYYPPYAGYAHGYGYPLAYPGYYGPSPFVGALVIGGGFGGRRFYR